MKVTTDVLSRDGKDIAFGDYSATWRFHRKIVHRALCVFGEGSASIEKISKSAGVVSCIYSSHHPTTIQPPDDGTHILNVCADLPACACSFIDHILTTKIRKKKIFWKLRRWCQVLAAPEV